MLFSWNQTKSSSLKLNLIYFRQFENSIPSLTFFVIYFNKSQHKRESKLTKKIVEGIKAYTKAVDEFFLGKLFYERKTGEEKTMKTFRFLYVHNSDRCSFCMMYGCYLLAAVLKKVNFVVTKSINHWSVVVFELHAKQRPRKLVRKSSNNNKIHPKFILRINGEKGN